MKHKLILTLVSLASVIGISTAAVPVYAAEVTCGVLDKSMCDNAQQKDLEKSGLFDLLRFAISLLTAGVGIAAVGVFVYAGILYSSAGGDSARVSQAKKLITDATIGLLLYAVVFFALNWLIPGGVIG
jgi:hypothetical protein